jgi:signal transduction histidine kinase
MTMAVELAEVAAGLPVAASLALAGGITNLREGRRRAALNEAMHELRRPLQVLNLCLPGDSPGTAPVESSLQLASVALDRLDREINGASLEEEMTAVSVRDLVEAAVGRWRRLALDNHGSLEVDLECDSAVVEGTPFDLAQALDNLLSNAIEHGGGEVKIRCRREGSSWLRISVIDAGVPATRKAHRRKPRRGSRCRRGHGLRVVGRIARRHGGSFTLSCAPQGSEATLRLPLKPREDEV